MSNFLRCGQPQPAIKSHLQLQPQLPRRVPTLRALPRTTVVEPAAAPLSSDGHYSVPTGVQELRGTDITTVFLRGSQPPSISRQPATTTNNHTASTTPSPAPPASYATPPSEKAVAFLKSLFLPDGYPASTTPDYLPYQLWATPTHVLGSLAHALTTSSLLQAVGVSAGPVATTAASAAMKWITKDGIGALGRFFVGGSLSQEFDKDPRRWRMVAELCTSTGAGLEIATAAFPQNFLLLASMGHFAKAVGKSMGKPVFRVIQTHFAADNNVGTIAAKEEVWEVVAQLTGYAFSLAVLTIVDSWIKEKGGVSSGTELVAIWAGVQSVHILLRYQSLKSLVFASLNDKRGLMLMSDHVSGRPLRSVTEVNRMEPLLPAHMCMEPRVHMGTLSITDLFTAAAATTDMGTVTSDQGQQNGGNAQLMQGSMGVHATSQHNGFQGSNGNRPEVEGGAGANGLSEGGLSARVSAVGAALLQLYSREEYILVWRDGEALVLLQETAGQGAILRALWQASWLHHHTTTTAAAAPQVLEGTSNGTTNGVTANGAGAGNGTGQASQGQAMLKAAAGGTERAAGMALLAASLQALEARYGEFEQEAGAVGWDVAAVLMGSGPVKFRTI